MQVVAQPYVHDLAICLRAPTSVLSVADGQVHHAGAQGLFHGDVRHLAEMVVLVDGRAPVAVGSSVLDATRMRFVAAIRDVGDPIADPTVRLERTRSVREGSVDDELTIVNDSRTDVVVDVTVRMATDMAPLGAVRNGAPSSLVAPTDSTGWRVGARTTRVAVASAPETPIEVSAGDRSIDARWEVAIASRSRATLAVTIDAGGGNPTFTAAPPAGWADRLRVRSARPDLAPLVRRAVDDLDALLLSDGLLADGDDCFAAAGVPWYSTLFGRDSIWTARFALPLDVGLAGGTLRTLARRQATTNDASIAAEPGKILHEVRTGPLLEAQLPPEYYGTVDATPLWISLLHDAWCWGLADDDVAALVPSLDAAMGWLLAHDGYLTYRDESGRGLANQGWKDSEDAVQDGRGVVAPAPITLCEVQGYAHRAALDGARLLDAFGRPGSPAAREFAARLRTSFRANFWCGEGAARYPAIALDGDGRRVDALTSNIGHLPASGLLDADEVAVVARHLGGPALGGGFGLRTLASTHPRFNPLGYHTGSIWAHDTAIAVAGLAGTGHADVAARLAMGLVDAAPTFDARLPELYGGWDRADGDPLAYPASCRPQAWASASVLVVLQAALGLRVDVPAGTIDVRPDPAFAALHPLAVDGLRIGEHTLSIAVDADGRADVDTDAPLTLSTP